MSRGYNLFQQQSLRMLWQRQRRGDEGESSDSDDDLSDSDLSDDVSDNQVCINGQYDEDISIQSIPRTFLGIPISYHQIASHHPINHPAEMGMGSNNTSGAVDSAQIKVTTARDKSNKNTSSIQTAPSTGPPSPWRTGKTKQRIVNE